MHPKGEHLAPRRFEPATESEARKRLDLFRSVIKGIQNIHPEVLGATVYGSMIKGDQAHAQSDIDSFVYIDAENEHANPNLETYRQEILNQMGAKPQDDHYYEDLKIKALSGPILDQEIADQLDYYKQHKAYLSTIEEKYAAAGSMAEKTELLKQEPFRLLDQGIIGMFHARIGSGIEKYRKMFLEKLVSIPDRSKAEEIWSEVVFLLDTFEKRNEPVGESRIPATISDALKMYAPELKDSIG